MSFLQNSIFQKNSDAKLRQQQIKKRVYTYDTMNDEKWDQYATAVDECHNRWDLSSMNIQNINDLNKYWSLIKNVIMNAAITTIDNHITTNQQKKKETTPKMDESFAHIKYLNKLLRNTSNKNIPSYFPTLLQRWSNVKSYIHDLALHYQYTINLPNNIHLTSFNSIRNSVKQISSI